MPVKKKEKNRCQILIVCSLVFLILATGIVRGHQTNPWDSFKGNERNTGLSPYGTSDYQGEIIWTFDTGRPISASPVLGFKGEVYIGSVSGYFYSISSAGLQRWSYQTGNSIRSSAAIGNNGQVYVGSEDGIFYAFTDYGEVVWEYQTEDKIRSSPVVGDDGTIYVGSDDGYLYSFTADGDLNWRHDLESRISSSPAISDDVIYIGRDRATLEGDAGLVAVDINGAEIWNRSLEGNINSAVMVDDNGYVYAGASDGKLYSFYSDGTLRWTFSTDSRIHSSPSIDGEDNVYITSMDNKIYSLTERGELRWSYETEGYITTSPAVCSDGHLYFGSSDGRFYSLAAEGTERKVVNIGQSIISSAAIGSDGTVYFGGIDGRVYAINGIEESKDIPPTPISLKGEIGDGFINISWDMPEQEHEVNSFNIYRRHNESKESYLYSVEGSKNYFKDSTIKNGETYEYRISAVNQDGESTPSDPFVITVTTTEEEEQSLFYRRGTITLLSIFTLVLFLTLCMILKRRREEEHSQSDLKDEKIQPRYTCPFCGNLIYISQQDEMNIKCPRCKSTIIDGLY